MRGKERGEENREGEKRSDASTKSQFQEYDQE